MKLELSDAETAALRRALDTYLTEFRIDAARTDAPVAKQEMWEDEHLLSRIRAKL
jgi:hypothetical protein